MDFKKNVLANDAVSLPDNHASTGVGALDMSAPTKRSLFMSTQPNSRRDFIKRTALVGVASSGLASLETYATGNIETVGKTDHLNFLFQGDSITDGNRGRSKDPNHTMGHGYTFSIASRVGEAFAENANMFYNRGISGNKITDLEKRWQKDTLDLKPDVLSIFVGINDTASVVRQEDIITPEKYEEVYRSLLTQTRSQLPACLFVLCEPFILPVGKVKEKWMAYQDDIQKRQDIVRRLSKDFNAVFVPFQKVMNDAVKRASADYWMWDGIHPTYSGHELLTKEWLRQVSSQLRFLKKMHF